jgi:uncharacterized repeat protein (TIGR01451 family)
VNASGRSFASAFFVSLTRYEESAMNIFDTLFPPRSRAPSAAAGRSRGRQPVRRNWLARFSGEKLEDRLALAVVTPFTPVFAENLTGNISFAANTLMTAPGDSPEAIAARNGTGPQNTLNDDYWNMAYVDIDSDTSTFNSSSADLVIPVGANVEFARLYWGGRCADTVPDSLLETVKFKVGAGAYATLTGALVGNVVGGVVGRTDIQTYQCYVDVKSLVTGAGTYTVANVQGQEGAKNTCNGWSLVVAYSAPGSPGEVPRNLTVFQGFADVNDNSATNRNVTIPYSGFQAPQTGPVNATLGFVTYEGDLGITGDQAYFKSQSSASETLLSDVPANPANNFFNSTISNRGLLVTSKNPDYVNQFGFDADLVTADNIIQNGDTGAQIRVTSTQDQYYPGVITSAIDIYQPGIAVTKTVEDLNGGVVDPGDTLEYTVQVSNAAGLFDGATNVVLEDLIPTNTTYVPGSLVITAGANAGPMTDLLDVDQAEFTGSGVRFQLGVGATGTPSPQGGSLAPGAATTVTFRVQVNPSIIGGTTIANTAVVSYASQTFKVSDSRAATVSIDCPAVDLKIDKTGDVPVVTAGDGVNHTFTITVTNTSTSAANNVVVADTWPAGFVPGTIVPSVGTFTAPDPVTGNFTWTIGTLAGKASATLTAQYTVPASTPQGTETNKAVVTTSTFDPNPKNNTATFDIDVVQDVDLSLDKVTVSPVVAGQLVSYTITIKNSGKSDVTAALVSDPFAGVLSGVTWTAVFSGGATDSGTGDIAETIDLPAGGSVLYSVTGLLASSASGDLVNTATVTSPFDTATDTVTDPITTNVNILVNKTGDITYKAGAFLNFTVVVSNLGTSVANGVAVFDALPANVVNWSWNVSYSVGSGPADGSPNSAINSAAPINKTVNLASLGTATFVITALTVDNQTNDITNVVTATIGQTTVTSAWTSIYDGPINPTEDVPALILGTDDGCYVNAIVRIIDPVTGGQLAAFTPYPGFKGSVRVASGDVDGDGIADIVVAPGRAIPGLVRVFSAAGFPLAGGAYDFYPFGIKYRGGVEVAVGNIDGVGRNEIIAAMSSGNGMVRVFKVNGAVNPVPFRSFLPFGPKYAAGVMITAGDYGTYTNGTWTAVPDGKAEIAVGTNAGPVSQVKIFKAAPITPVAVRTFLPFGTKFRQGVTLSSAKYSSAVVDDVFVGTGAGGKSRLAIFKGSGALATPIINVFSSYFSRPNAALFTAALDLPTGTGSVNNIYGVQGRGATNGLPSGAGRYTGSLPVTALGSWKAPLRIAPIILRVPG